MPRTAPARCGAAALLVAALALVLVTEVASHGLMVHPPSRNWLAYLNWNFNYPHGLSMGGARVVSDYGKMTYPNGKRGMCGDAQNEQKWDNAGEVTKTYVSGQIINVDVLVSVNHMGRFNMQVCPLDAKAGQGKCRSLYLKADGHSGSKSWYLPGIPKWGGGNSGYEGPRYGDNTFEAYQLPAITQWSGWGLCKSQQLCNMFKDMWVYRTKWVLPQGFSCQHCKLQWVWTTGHSCWPPCEDGNPQPQCQNKQVFPSCGSPGAAYPEEFANCADIRILDNAKIDTSADKPAWDGSVSRKGGYWGSIRPSVMNSGDRRK